MTVNQPVDKTRPGASRARIGGLSIPRPLRILLALGAALLLSDIDSARAQPASPVTPIERSFLERLALARAHANLYERVQQLPLTAELSLGAWAARDITRERSLRMWIRACPRHGGARVYSDGTCEVDIRLTPEELATQLATLIGQEPSEQDAGLTATDILTAAREWLVLWSTGSSALTEKSYTGQPIGWEDVSLEGIQLARRAAAADAIHALLEQAGRLKVTPARRLRELFESDDDVFEAVHQAVQDAATILVENAPDQVAAAEARLGMRELIRILTDVHQEHYRGDLFHAPDFREMALSAKQSELRAEGLATPPDRYHLREPYELIELDTPPWAATTLAATGTCDPLDTEAFPREVRLELARFNGMNELRKKVEALVVKDDVTVEQFLGYHRDLNDDVVIFLSGARLVGQPHTEPDGTLHVHVELPLERLWKIVRHGMQQVEADASDDDDTPGNQPTEEVRP
jgi:hypothetical protein